MFGRQHVNEIAKGWPTLLAAMLGYGSGSALFMYTSNFFVLPLEKAFGWSRAEIALGVSITLVANGVMMPVIGKLIDNFGPRKVGTICFLGYSLGVLLLAEVPLSLPVYYACMLFISCFFAGTGSIVFARLVAAKFASLRASALALMQCGTVVILFPLAPAITGAVKHSYSDGYLVVAGIALLLGLPMLFLATWNGSAAKQAARADILPPGLTLREAASTITYWQMVVALLASSIALGGILSQLSTVMLAKGYEAHVTLLASTFVGSVLIGRLVVGAMMDFLNAELVAAIVMALAAVAMLVLNQSPAILAIGLGAVVVAGSSMGAESDFSAYFTAKFFGQRNYSSILGTIAMFISFGLALGGLIYGSLFDMFGNYDPALWLSCGGFTISAVVFVSLWLRGAPAHATTVG